MLPQTLINIIDFLRANPLSLSKHSRDGRINSAFNEDEIFHIITNNFDINRPNMRDWVDFSFIENDMFCPINIKVSTTKSADNLNCKLGIYYALTGQKPDFSNGIVWEEYFQKLSQNLTPNSADYYFLIINKNNSSDVFATSLKQLNKLVPNGNNLPFQAKWDENRTLVSRDFETAKDFILHYFGESLKLRSEAYFSYRRYFENA